MFERTPLLPPWRAPDLCPACGARVSFEQRCSACRYVARRALWTRKQTGSTHEVVHDALGFALRAIVLAAIVGALVTYAMGVRGADDGTCARYAIVSAVLTLVARTVIARERLEAITLSAALTARWEYEDPAESVRARGPAPLIEGPAYASFERRLSLREGLPTDDDVQGALARLGLQRAAIEAAIERLHSVGALRIFVEHVRVRTETVDRTHPLRGVREEHRLLLAAGPRAPERVSGLERRLLDELDEARADLPAQREREARGYRALLIGPQPALRALSSLLQSVESAIAARADDDRGSS